MNFQRARKLAICRISALLFAAATASVILATSSTISVAGPSGGKWAIVLCKFADQNADPVIQGFTVTRPWLSTFFTESGKGQGGMFDYWSQASLGQTSLSGTTLLPVNTANSNNGWYQLPAPPAPGGRGDLAWYSQQVDSKGNPIHARGLVWNDCVKDAESKGAIFAGFYGILVVTNAPHEDSALGTGQVCPVPSSPGPVACVVINPLNLYVSDVAHEMGHGYGLNHGWDTLEDCQYCDPYDIMSWHTGKAFSGTLGVPDPVTRAQTGPGLDAPDLDKLGWMPANRIYNYSVGESAQITLAPLETPSDQGYLMAKVATGAYYYTLEYRHKRGMDQGLNDNIVLIHQVRTDGLFYLVDSFAVGGNVVRVIPELTAGGWYHSDDLGVDVIPTGETAVVRIFSKGTSPQPPPVKGSGGKACELAGGTWTCGEPLHGKVTCGCEF